MGASLKKSARHARQDETVTQQYVIHPGASLDLRGDADAAWPVGWGLVLALCLSLILWWMIFSAGGAALRLLGA